MQNPTIKNKKFFLGFSWLFLEKIIRVPTSFIVNLLVINYLGPKSFGELSYIVLLAGLFAFLSNVGLPMITQQRISMGEDHSKVIINSVFLRFIFGIVSVIFTFLLLFFTNESYLISILVMFLSLQHLFQAPQTIADFYKAKAKQEIIAVGFLLQNVFISSLKLLFIFFELDFFYIVLIYLLEIIFLSVYFLYFFPKVLKNKSWRLISVEYSQKLLLSSYPLALGTIAIYLQTNIDRYLINQYLSLEQLGIYAASFMLISGFHFLPQLMSSTFMPMIIKYKNQKAMQNSVLLGLYSLSFWSGIFICFLFYLFGETLINLVFSEDFTNLSTIVLLHSFTLPIIFIGSISNALIISKNLVWFSLLRAVIGAFLNVILNLYLISSYGLIGVVIAAISAQIASNLFLDLLHIEIRQQFFMKLKSLNPLFIHKLIAIRKQ